MAEATEPRKFSWQRVGQVTLTCAAVGAAIGALVGLVAGATEGDQRRLDAGERVWLPDFTLYADEGGGRTFVQDAQHVTLLRRSRWVEDRWLVRLGNGNEGWVDVPQAA